MPKISQRAERTPASPIRRLVPYAEAAKKRGIKVHHLNIGQPDIKTPAAAVEVLRNANYDVIEYTHSAGTESYRARLSDFYATYGIALTAEQLIITNGGSEALSFAVLACADAGDEIIIPEPFYANYNGFSESTDVHVVAVPSSIDDNFALPKAADFERAITPRTRAILICNPSNPTGKLYTRDELTQLANLAIKHDLYLIADEVYRDFCYDGAQHISVLSLEGIDNHVVMIDSISKRYSACGARIGLFATRNPTLYAAAMRLAQARLSPSSVTQVLAEALIDTPKSYFEEVNKEYDARRKLLLERLSQMEGVRYGQPDGAFYLIAELPVADASEFSQWLLEKFEYRGETVMFAPASGFYATAGSGKKEVRIAYVLCAEDLHRAMDCLAAALKVYGNS
jgi:aspartate aminotransferase